MGNGACSCCPSPMVTPIKIWWKIEQKWDKEWINERLIVRICNLHHPKNNEIPSPSIHHIRPPSYVHNVVPFQLLTTISNISFHKQKLNSCVLLEMEASGKSERKPSIKCMPGHSPHLHAHWQHVVVLCRRNQPANKQHLDEMILVCCLCIFVGWCWRTLGQTFLRRERQQEGDHEKGGHERTNQKGKLTKLNTNALNPHMCVNNSRNANK